ncbi:Sua5/YciO/YrdC/YwlC family protein [Tepidicaulis marinus]|uniref:Threonylcarbamoyl-AMP synthase n=1 Tax=Tepidicaulis marinus TaxID=1333998 RepID=A0A081BDJ8_9HYPH|nr:L-threonylcarbamoyladenylate synthase [Tepidicaulis marinus]GAK46116.1 Sua5/YciO/YrdC/YwlC family protein [Tepidicaulis marinus]
MPLPIWPPDADHIKKAADALRAGKLVAFPTETVYGLGADATQDSAVARIFEAKGRPRFNPLIVHLPSLQAAQAHARFDARARALAKAFWPGALTLVLPRRAETPLSLLVSAGLPTVALRVPQHPLALKLLRESGLALAAPSANRSGRLSPTLAAHVARSLEEAGALVAGVLDGGPCTLGLESTVIGLPEDGPPTLLRPGAIARAEIEAVLGMKLAEAAEEEGEAGRSSPGQLASHYAPEAPIRLNAKEVNRDEVLLAFGPDALQGAALTLNLSRQGDLREAAANLFRYLQELDAQAEGKRIAVMPVPETGLGEAINDRLRRAAAPRS